MLNRQRSLRFVFAGLALFLITSVSFASPWTTAMQWLGFSAENPAAESPAPAAMMAPGACDTLGPIEVEGTILGTTPTAYATLGLAVAAINAGTHTGVVSIDVCGSTTEAATSITLNASGSGAASYTAINMIPVGGAARTITAATTAGIPMIDFSGADNVTIDGLNTGGNSLTISNTTASATSGTATIRFIGGATNNTITNANIQGSNSASVATNGAIIFFSTDSVTTAGNDNNTISNNNIGPAGANLPSKAILCNGSTTTTAIGNSGLNINNNNIFDFFGVAVTSAGVAVNGGCNTFSITNNRFYQTATRTWTTGALHTPILMNSSTATSGVQGMTITGNIIGYASNTQTGTYTLTGSTGKFAGIQFNGITAGTVSNINNNTVASVSMTGVTSSGTTTTAPFAGIAVGGASFVGNVIANGNTIGSQTATGSLTFSTTTTTATDVFGIFNASSDPFTSNNNTVGGISFTNLGASGTMAIYGIRAWTGSALLWTATGNTVGGSVPNSIQLNATGTSSQVIGMHSSIPTANLTSNTVRNMTTNIGTGTTTSASVIGISAAAAVNFNFSQNTIFNLSNTNTTAASVVTGIQFNGGSSNVVDRNNIHSLTVATNSATAEVNGIRVAGGTTVYRNNMIAIGAGIANAIGAAATNAGTTGVNGINEALGTNSFFHNSVYIGGSPTAGTGASYAFNGTQTAVTRSFRDNIFFNARNNSGATGKNYAIKINGTAANPAGLTINNNVYFANGTGAAFGFFNSLDVANLAAWKTAVGQDAASFEANPQFNDPTNATPDLHLHPTNATVAEGNGADVGVTDDFDGQTRSGLTPVDIGADAGNFNGVDLAAPAIAYTAFLNTSSTANRVLSVTITDATGVATGGNAPRIYFNKNGGAYSSTACSLASGSVTNGVWNCTIDYTLVGGVVATDVIRYFVVAQDTLGFLGAAPSAGFTGTDVNSVTSPPTTPSQYTITPTLTGTLNVGTGETYTSLTNAGGIFQAINNSEVTGNITINITSDLSGETGTVALNPYTPGFGITIKPSGAARAINGTGTNNQVIVLAGADNVTIDGSLAGGTDRSLTITNGNTAASGVIFVASLGTGAGATNNTIKNTVVRAGSAGTSAIFTYGIFAGDISGAAAGADNDNLTIQNNQILRARTGIQAVGTAAGIMDNLNISQNIIGDPVTAANSVGRSGVVVSVVNSASIASNEIRNLGIAADTAAAVGVSITSSTNSSVSFNTIDGVAFSGSSLTPVGIVASTATTGLGINGNTVSNVTSSGSFGPLGIAFSTGVTNSSITRNNVSNIRYTGTGGYGGKGIEINTANAASNITVANNFVSNITGDGWSAGANILDTMMGIRVTGTTGGVNLYYNSVNMGSGDFAGNTQPATVSAALYVGASATALNVRNNILVNNLNNTAITTDKNYAFYSDAANTAYTAINNNDYWVPVSAAAGPQVLGFLGSDRLLLSDIQTATGQDANSISANPLFTSATDLHIASSPALSPAADAGVPIAGVSADFDSDPRASVPPPPVLTSDIGADEIVQMANGTFPSGTFYNAILTPGTYAGNVEVTNSLTIGGAGTGVNIGANTLTIGCNAVVNGAGGSNYIIGNVEKDFCAAGTFTFPVGTTPNGSRPNDGDEKPMEGQTFDPEGVAIPEYTPVDVNITAGVFPSSLTVNVTDAFLPQLVQANAISRYWTVTETGNLTADMTFHYLDAPFDVNGNESLYKAFRRSGGFTTEYVPSSNNPAANTFTATGVTNFSDWGAAAAVASSSNASIAGRVTTANGNGIRNAMVMITGGSLTAPIVVNTGAMGYYSFDNLRVGETYVIQIGAKRFRFANPTRVVTLQDAISDLDFVANPQE